MSCTHFTYIQTVVVGFLQLYLILTGSPVTAKSQEEYNACSE